MKRFLALWLILVTLAAFHVSAEAARTFNGTSTAVRVDTAVVTEAPFTVCLWFRSTNDASALAIVSVQQATVLQYWAIRQRGDTTDVVDLLVVDGGAGTANPLTTNTYTINTWQHVCAAEITTTSREVWLNGDIANKGTNAISRAPSGINSVTIGRRDASGGGIFFAGDIGEVCIWNAALVDAEVAALANKTPCEHVRRINLISCPKLWGNNSPELDTCGPRAWTLVNSPAKASTHPPVGPHLR